MVVVFNIEIEITDSSFDNVLGKCWENSITAKKIYIYYIRAFQPEVVIIILLFNTQTSNKEVQKKISTP